MLKRNRLDQILDAPFNADHFDDEITHLTFSPSSTDESELLVGSSTSQDSAASPLRLFFDDKDEEEVKDTIAEFDDEDPTLIEPPKKKPMLERTLPTQAELPSSTQNAPSRNLIDFLRSSNSEYRNNDAPIPYPFVRTSSQSSTLQNINNSPFTTARSYHGRDEHKNSQKSEPIDLPSEAISEPHVAPKRFAPFPILPRPKFRQNGRVLFSGKI